MKEERIKFYRPRKIALIGLAPHIDCNIELFEGTEKWEGGLGFGLDRLHNIEAILGNAMDNECHPCVIKDIGDSIAEVELIVRYKEEMKVKEEASE